MLLGDKEKSAAGNVLRFRTIQAILIKMWQALVRDEFLLRGGHTYFVSGGLLESTDGHQNLVDETSCLTRIFRRGW